MRRGKTLFVFEINFCRALLHGHLEARDLPNTDNNGPELTKS